MNAVERQISNKPRGCFRNVRIKSDCVVGPDDLRIWHFHGYTENIPREGLQICLWATLDFRG